MTTGEKARLANMESAIHAYMRQSQKSQDRIDKLEAEVTRLRELVRKGYGEGSQKRCPNCRSSWLKDIGDRFACNTCGHLFPMEAPNA